MVGCVQPWKPVVMLCRKKCTRALCAWLMNIIGHAERTRGVVITEAAVGQDSGLVPRV